MANLKVDIGSLTLENPVLLASGILGETGSSLLRVFMAGAGGVVSKSIGPEPREGHRNPTFVEVAGGYINAMGLPNPGVEDYAPELMTAVAGGAKVIGSVFGNEASQYARIAASMQEYGVSAVELNLSCPHAKGTGMELGTDPGTVRSITRAVREAVDVPVLVKLTPNISDITVIARAAAEGGADGVVAINTLKAMAIDITARRPVLGNLVGGFSGPALKHVGLRMVWDIYRTFHPDLQGGSGSGGGDGAPVIIGAGGVETGVDAAEYIMAGAAAVQVGSAVVDGGPEAPGIIARELDNWMDANGFSDVGAMVGLAHRNSLAD